MPGEHKLRSGCSERGALCDLTNPTLKNLTRSWMFKSNFWWRSIFLFFFLSCFWCKLWEVNLERTISQCECEDRGDSVSWLRSHHGGDLQACLTLSAWPSKCAVGRITLLQRIAVSDTKNSITGSFSIKGTRKTCIVMKCTRNEMSLTWTWDSHFTSWWKFHNPFYSNIFVILKSVI